MFNVQPTAKVILRRGSLSSDIRQTGEAGDQTVTPGLHGEWFIHYKTAASIYLLCNKMLIVCYDICQNKDTCTLIRLNTYR